jgi:NTP pyrophosphatase (non-canonical NTP hydrolase)
MMFSHTKKFSESLRNTYQKWKMQVDQLSLTLRDAQHLCWKNFRKINEKLDQERGRGWTPFVMVTDLLEEAGEVAAVVKGLEGFKPPEKPKTKEMLATELSDMLYIAFVLAEHYGVDLEEAFMQTVNDYILRFIK